jgi:thioesterase DpgC
VQLYDRVTAERTRSLRLAEVLVAARAAAPGLLPDEQLLATDRSATLAAKHGYERDEAEFLAAVLADSECGAHLARAMRHPLEGAYELLEQFRRDDVLDLGFAHLRRDDRTAVLELRNPAALNAEDHETLPCTEIATDVAFLDPHVDVLVLRGGVVQHERYRGRRVFNAGLNLKALARGSLPFLFFADRDLGWVAKLYYGLELDDDGVEETPWIAVVDSFAIGGGTQLLLVADHVIAETDAYFSLPATNEGFIPGAAPLRLPRTIGPRLARDLLQRGRVLRANEPDTRLLVDTVVGEAEIDEAVASAAEALTAAGKISVSANRRALREGEESHEEFVRYCALYVREQARCMFNPELAAKLEASWLR